MLGRVSTPATSSRDEWSEAFMDLPKLIMEGFETKPIRGKLDEEDVSYDDKDRTIALLEKLLNKGNTSGEGQNLAALRIVQAVRSKAKGHAGSSKVEELARNAVMEHETFGNHFRYVCTQAANELEAIEPLFSNKAE